MKGHLDVDSSAIFVHFVADHSCWSGTNNE
jgi:hypothetical protein